MKKLLVTSFVKEELLAAAGCTSVSSAALDWLQTETEKLIAYAAAQGKKTAGGKLQPPDTVYPVTQGGPQGSRGDKDFPEKVCWRVKEWRNMSEEERTRHLTETFISWFALNTGEKVDALARVYITPVAEAQEPAEPEEEDKHETQDEKPKTRSRRPPVGQDGLSAL